MDYQTVIPDLKPHTVLYFIETGRLSLFNSIVHHSNCAATCPDTIQKTGKQVVLGLFVVTWIIYEWMGNSTRQKFEIRLWKIFIG